MYPHPDLPKPLRPTEFYLLLALSRGPLHGYALKAVVQNDSLGSVYIPDSKIYLLLTSLIGQAFIDDIGKRPTGKSGVPRTHYAITHHGTLRLKEELTRLDHAIKIGKSAGLMEDSTPIDIQRLLLNSKQKPEA